MNLPRLVAFSLFGVFLFTALGVTPALAENLSFPGSALRKDPFWEGKKSLYSKQAASNNVVSVTGKTISGAAYGGITNDGTDSSGNTLTMTGGTVQRGLYGGYADDSGNTVKNTVIVKGGEVSSEELVGGNSDLGNSTGNKVAISGGTIYASVTGGFVDDGQGQAKNNRVTISGKAFLADEVRGGASEGAGTVSLNKVFVKGGTIDAEVYGGFGEGGHVNSNSVTISKGLVNKIVFGGNAAKRGTVANNTVELAGGTAKKHIYGGAATKGNATGNTATISSGTARGMVVGGMSKKGQVSDNKVFVQGGTVMQNLIGGYSKSSSKHLQNNSVSISGAATKVTGSNIYGGLADNTGRTFSEVLGNTVTITGGEVSPEQRIYGGYNAYFHVGDNKVLLSGGKITALEVVGGTSGNGQVFSNTVTVSKKAVVNADITGGAFFKEVNAAVTIASLNQVFIKGGKITGTVRGGASYGGGGVDVNSVTMTKGTVIGDIIGGYTLSGSAMGNTVSISGGTVVGTIYGAYKEKNIGDIAANFVVLSGSPDLTRATLYGAFIAKKPGAILFGNNLVVDGFSGSVKKLCNFGKYQFTLPSNVQNGSTILAVTGKTAARLTDAEVSILGFAKGAAALAKGSKITLIKNTSGTPFEFKGTGVKRGAVEVYNFAHVASNSKNMVVKVTSVTTDAKVNSLTKNHAETLDLLTRGADRLADQTMTAVRQGASLASGLFMFGDASASLPGISWSSEGKVSSSLAGLGFSSRGDFGTLALGSFFESGWTESHAGSQAGFTSAALRDKDQSSYGSGLLARFDHKSGLYAEGTLRYGKAHSSFKSGDLRDGFGNKAAFDSGSRYTSFHAGLGHIYNLSDNLTVDTYSKLFVTRLKGDEVDLLGDRLSMQDSESRRIRSGAKFSFALDERLTAFAGLAHEYEADGKVRANIAGHTLTRDKTRGHSAMIQAGFSYKPIQDAPLSLYVDYKNYAGARKDANASAGILFEF